MLLCEILPKTAVKETSFTGAGDIKFQLVIRALSLENWNEVEAIAKTYANLLLARKDVTDRVRRLATENVKNQTKNKVLKHLRLEMKILLSWPFHFNKSH